MVLILSACLTPDPATEAYEERLADLEARLSETEATLAETETALAEAEAAIAVLESELSDDLVALDDYLEVDDEEVRFVGANVYIQSGSGVTHDDGPPTLGLGNLTIGYDDEPGLDRSGSHNIVLGGSHNYSSYGGLIGGYGNTVSGAYAVAFGANNFAGGQQAVILGGIDNEAPGSQSVVVGGTDNKADGHANTVVGGYDNMVGQGIQNAVVLGGTSIENTSSETITPWPN